MHAWSLNYKLGLLGVGLVQHSPCGPLCLIPSLPCTFGPADFAAQIASEGQKLQASKVAFEASLAPSAPAPAASIANPPAPSTAKLAAPDSVAFGAQAPADKSASGPSSKGKVDVKNLPFSKGPKAPKDPGGSP